MFRRITAFRKENGIPRYARGSRGIRTSFEMDEEHPQRLRGSLTAQNYVSIFCSLRTKGTVPIFRPTDSEFLTNDSRAIARFNSATAAILRFYNFQVRRDFSSTPFDALELTGRLPMPVSKLRFRVPYALEMLNFRIVRYTRVGRETRRSLMAHSIGNGDQFRVGNAAGIAMIPFKV